MAKQQQKSKAPTPPTPYEMMGVRIQKIINSPAAQKARSVVIEKAHHESQEDWERFLEEVAENDNVTLGNCNNGNVRLTWTATDEA